MYQQGRLSLLTVAYVKDSKTLIHLNTSHEYWKHERAVLHIAAAMRHHRGTVYIASRRK
jgi:hypothetical protein